MSAKSARTTDALSTVEFPVDAATPGEWTWSSEDWTVLPTAAPPEPSLRLVASTSSSSDAFQAALEAAAHLRELAATRVDERDPVIDGNRAAVGATQRHGHGSIDEEAFDSRIMGADDDPNERHLPRGGYEIIIADASRPVAERGSRAVSMIADNAGEAIEDGYQPGPRVRQAGQDPGTGHGAGAGRREAVPPVKARGSYRIGHLMLAAAAGVVATLAWQSYGDGARHLIATRIVPQLSWSSLASAMNRPAGAPVLPADRLGAGAPHSPASDSARAEAAAPNMPTATEGLSVAARSPESLQLETMARDLAAMRQRIDELAATQAQMSRGLQPKEP